MNVLFKAIADHFKADALDPFYISMNGRLFPFVVDQEWPFPYSVFMNAGDTTDQDFTDTTEDVTIQFDVYTRNSSNVQASNLIEELKSMFDGAPLNVAGWNLLSWTRTNTATPKNDFTQVPPIQGYYVEYEALLEKQRTC